MQARPLDLGDVFDRAIGLYARNFRAFVAIAAVAIVPFALVQYVTLRLEGPQMDALAAIWQHPERLGTQRLPSIFDSPGIVAMAIVSLLVGYLTMSLSVCAVAVATSDAYRNEPLTVGGAYRKVLARWPAILSVLGAALAALIACYIASILLITIPLIVVMTIAPGFALIVPIVTLIALAGVFFALVLILAAAAFAFFGIVVEGRAVGDSIHSALSRIFVRAQFGRAFLCSVAAAAVMTVPVGLIDTLAFVGLGRWPGAYVALDTVVRCVCLPFSALILAVYYFDVRIRREGFDLENGGFGDELDDAGYAPTAYLSGRERALVKRFIERRDALTPGRRAAIAAQLAEPVRERVPEELRGLDDESLLERL